MRHNKIKSLYTLCTFISMLFMLLSCKQDTGNDTSQKENTQTADASHIIPAKKTKNKKKMSMSVTATAYNSVERQTKKGNIGLAAWGDILQPGEKAIAVSRDLIDLGLDHNEEIEIEGLDGIYVVKDKMNRRWRNKIDIYMGLDEKAALQWGKKNVVITFNPKDSPNDKFSQL